MNIAKEGLALLMFHPSFNVQPHRECISLIGTAWDIPVGDTQKVTSLLDRELDAILRRRRRHGSACVVGG